MIIVYFQLMIKHISDTWSLMMEEDVEHLILRHNALIEKIHDLMTEDEVGKFKSFCLEKVGRGVLEKKKDVRDVLRELEDRDVIRINKYDWLYDTFNRMNRPIWCRHIDEVLSKTTQPQPPKKGILKYML